MTNSRARILALETSCDETACAFLAGGRVIGERVYSQWRRHQRYGGVVPELASRDHLRRLLPLTAELLSECGMHPTAIAYTSGPGLASALLSGATLANALAFAWSLPAVPVNHLHGHLMSPRLSRPDFAFPYMSLLVSGGHTQLWLVKSARDCRLLGETMDDAAGEAFDKTAILLGLGYPGGAKLEKLASKGDSTRFHLPSPAQKEMRFSFSGLKSAARRLVEQHPNSSSDIAAAFQRAACEGLALQSSRALKHHKTPRLAIVGGVAQNNALWQTIQRHCTGVDLHRPPPSHCGDNAAMIALSAYLDDSSESLDYSFTVSPRMSY